MTKLTQETKAQILETYQLGMSFTEVGRIFNLSHTSVGKVVREFGKQRSSAEGLRLAIRRGLANQSDPEHLEKEDFRMQNKLINECNAELDALEKHHSEIGEAYRASNERRKELQAHGIGIDAGSRGLAARMESRSVEVRSSGNGEAV